MIRYLFISSIGITLLSLVYILFLKKQTFFQQNRLTLLLGLIISLLFPAVNMLSYTADIVAIQSLPTVYLPELTIGEGTSVKETLTTINYWSILLWLYIGITSALLIRFIFSNIKLIRFISKSKWEKFEGNHLVFTEGKYPTFAYLKYIFWDNSKELNKKEQLLILRHEETHVKELHSIDIFAMELIKILFWFHPAIYIIDAALRTQHEYIADKKANEMTNDASYGQLMVRSLFEDLSLSVGHGFQFSTVKTRIKMLKQERSAQWKRAFSIVSLISILGSIVVLQSCVDNEVRAMNDQLKDVNVKTLYGFNIEDKTYWDTQGKIFSSNLEEGTSTITSDQLEPGNIETINVIKETSKMPVMFHGKVDGIIVMTFRDALKSPIISQIKSLPYTERDYDAEKEFASKMANVEQDKEEIFEVVENPAGAPNGMQAFYDKLGQNIKWPKELARTDVEGKVYVQFIVNKEGKAEDVKVVRGLHPSLDEVARAAVEKTVVDWHPATQRGQVVKQRLILPVHFKL
ncbi:TonB family protein [Flammeovirga yaeyamensis]|uniref:TonB family protein n=1 Tax=Flammeovirga yaeyamensis TaxID=367791 RepID=A0AAX1N809_9BACT|nr:M56 family metallopeptidase [Flammeovirga yaeyamensis]MBB3697968.1 TonB family protein [Flammeovirga yaeyamensis]NMF35680.1 TonB family protein [Flammeovirga yaeyamensis]QWG03366.1 TonB family protein [Flammeovirga yaeyamensis]